MKWFILGVLCTMAYYHQAEVRKFANEVVTRTQSYHKSDAGQLKTEDI